MPLSRPWAFTLEYSIWCAAWAAAAGAMTAWSPSSGTGLKSMVSWVAAFPMLAYLLLAWGMSKITPSQMEVSDICERLGDSCSFLVPPLLSLLLLALPMIATTTALYHILPSVYRWRLVKGAGRWNAKPLWLICLISFAVTSLCLFWPFLGAARHFEALIRIGYETAIPPVIDEPTFFDFLLDILWLFAFVVLPLLVGPLVPMFLRWAAVAGWRRFP